MSIMYFLIQIGNLVTLFLALVLGSPCLNEILASMFLCAEMIVTSLIMDLLYVVRIAPDV